VTRYFAQWVLLPDGWARDVRIDIGPGGTLTAVVPDSPPGGATLLEGPVVPGMPNAHSHVAQRALAGRAEGQGPGGDSFWSWRNAMYAFVERLEPDAFEAISAFAYAEMLEAGYTNVAEFHYLHHGRHGVPYANQTEFSERVVAAARAAGIGLTLLPTLYRFSDAGGVPPLSHQRRFVHDVAGFMRLWESLATSLRGSEDVRLGLGFHSLRAVTPEDIVRVLAAVEYAAPGERPPVHVHISEQVREVEAVSEVYGAPPIEVLARAVNLSPRWSLVHATHASEAELRLVAAAQAAIVVCPTTEANLGDGIPQLAPYRARKGLVAIGSDSNVTLDVAEELRWLEYAQRLNERRRHVFVSDSGRALGEELYLETVRAGAQSSGRPLGAIAAGRRADLVVLQALEDDAAEPPALDAYVFKSGSWRVRDVMTGGRFVVRDGAHLEREALRRRADQAARAMRATIA
jgi:formimidoylglutamate deiminase